MWTSTVSRVSNASWTTARIAEQFRKSSLRQSCELMSHFRNEHEASSSVWLNVWLNPEIEHQKEKWVKTFLP